MFECPECGAAIDTRPNCYLCVACDFFEERRFVDVDARRTISRSDARRVVINQR